MNKLINEKDLVKNVSDDAVNEYEWITNHGTLDESLKEESLESFSLTPLQILSLLEDDDELEEHLEYFYSEMSDQAKKILTKRIYAKK
jgi:hypothetical protein